MNDKKFTKLLKSLIKLDLIYLDKKYNSNILLTAKALTIVKEKKIKNKISLDKLSESSLTEKKFLLKLKYKYNHVIKNNTENFINIYTENFGIDFKSDIKELEEFFYYINKRNIYFIDINTIAINATSVFTLKLKLKELEKLDRYLDSINTIILNKDYIEEITEKELKELEEITKKYKSVFKIDIDYILI